MIVLPTRMGGKRAKTRRRFTPLLSSENETLSRELMIVLKTFLFDGTVRAGEVNSMKILVFREEGPRKYFAQNASVHG